MGRPVVTFDNFWTVYEHLLNGLRTFLEGQELLNQAIQDHIETVQRMNCDEDTVNQMELLPDQRQRNVNDMAVGVSAGQSSCSKEGEESDVPMAQFTSDEEDDDVEAQA